MVAVSSAASASSRCTPPPATTSSPISLSFSCRRLSPPSTAPAAATSATSQQHGTDENRFERESDDFYRRIYEKYEEIAAREPHRVVTIRDDAAIDEIAAEIHASSREIRRRRAIAACPRRAIPDRCAPCEPSPRPQPPGLHSLPFYALKPWVKLGEPIRLFEYLHATYGNIAHYRFMGTPIVFINDPRLHPRDPRQPSLRLRQRAHRPPHEDSSRRRPHHL